MPVTWAKNSIFTHTVTKENKNPAHCRCAGMQNLHANGAFIRPARKAIYFSLSILKEGYTMGTLSEILSRAKQRAKEQGLPYAGCLTPAEAHQALQLTPAAKLVDVRSRPELDLVGKIPGAVHIEWSFYPDWKPNPDFTSQLEKQVDREGLLMFICRTGGRSNHAATTAAKAGFAECYNVLEGFEGEADPSGQRGKINGWKMAGLPWTHG
jgi:rhodanese-related sulfurtransferase